MQPRHRRQFSNINGGQHECQASFESSASLGSQVEIQQLKQLKSVDKLMTLILSILSELNLPRVCSNSPANGAQGGRALVTDALLRQTADNWTICQVKELVNLPS